MIVIKPISASETYPIRIAVLRNGISKDYRFTNDNARETFHLGAFADKQCIGISTFIKNNHALIRGENSYQLRGMAVLSDFRKQNIGKNLLSAAYQYLNKKNCKLLWCNARETAVPFYKKLGFTIIGSPFNIPQIGLHYVMYKEL